MAETRKQSNRRIRQEALREQLSNQGHLQHIVENIQKIEKLNPRTKTFSNQLNKLKTANDQRFVLVRKYLPDLKSVELTGDGGGPVGVKDWSQYTDEELMRIADGKDKP